MNRLHLAWARLHLAWALAFAAGCGAAPAMRAEAPAAPPAAEAAASYERILGTFVASPEAIAYLNPALAAARLEASYDAQALRRLAERFALLGAARGEAAARLHLGAALWWRGEADDGYRQVIRAQALFATAGDVEGLAHTHEWLGYFLRESGDLEAAGEHLALSHQLFERLEDHGAAARLLGYAED